MSGLVVDLVRKGLGAHCCVSVGVVIGAGVGAAAASAFHLLYTTVCNRSVLLFLFSAR